MSREGMCHYREVTYAEPEGKGEVAEGRETLQGSPFVSLTCRPPSLPI